MIGLEIDKYTYREISGQPQLWRKVYELILSEKKEIGQFLEKVLNKEGLRIILTGAGSSAFVGEAAQGIVQSNTGVQTQAIATTDIVTHPELFFLRQQPTLLVSFARSGNSPESIEAVKLADSFCDHIFHLIITCNKDGGLAKYNAKDPSGFYCLTLPEESNDQSLAMTGSFTSMLLSMLLLSDIANIDSYKNDIELISAAGTEILGNGEKFKEIISGDFERVVFLGSGPMLGVARECHLKLQELTDGQVICKHDSFLGFRHGPRAVVNEKTLVVYLFSGDEHVYKYEKDLADSTSADVRNIRSISYGRDMSADKNNLLSVEYKYNKDCVLAIVPATIVGQLLGYYKSLAFGLNPDNPSVSGTISRVVQGVIIYEHPNK